MSQSLRQSELFTAQDWEVLYRAFTQINFNASDPASINRALREYIQTNYAEDFSDWIESSEFVAIIDLLSYLAGTLAFKTDINARENFLGVAEARESILRLARFLSYNPRRNQPARGLLKLTSIQTDDDVFDAFGTNLANRVISWNNPDDPDWFERIVLILNNAFVSTNPFGMPLKSGTVADVKTQLYRLNALFGDSDLTFSATVSGESMQFEMFNTDFDDTLGFTERTPNLQSALHILYRSDGNGNGSKDTGFFMGFKQGRMARQVFNILNPIENQLLDINVDGINQSDVWVQSVNETGEVTDNWTKVPAIFSDNITFNTIDSAQRKIYSVVTRDDDQISVRFADGRFGAAPVGLIRVWYRVSNGLQYQIRPQEMSSINISIPYFNRRGIRRTLKIGFTLETTVSNSTPRETEEQIRVRAPMVYATQNRMVNGEDYNTFPLQSNLVTKMKSMVRVYSGHSRFIDLNDPTGNYQDINVITDDGIFYKEAVSSYAEIPVVENRTPEELVSVYVQPVMKSGDVFNYVYDWLVSEMLDGSIPVPDDMSWNRVTDGRFSSTGWFSVSSSLIKPGATLLFEKDGVKKWVTIAEIEGNPIAVPSVGTPGPVILSESLETGWEVKAIIPRFANTLEDIVSDNIQNRFADSLSFSLWYDYDPEEGNSHWQVQEPSPLEAYPAYNGSLIKLMSVEYLSGSVWRFHAPGIRYVFESLENVHFYFNGQNAVDLATRQKQQDLVRVLRVNEDLNDENGKALRRDFDLVVSRMIHYADGYADPHRVVVEFRDRDEDGYPDDPDTYYKLVHPEMTNNYLFWERVADGSYKPFYDMLVFEREEDRLVNETVLGGSVAFQIQGSGPERDSTFWRLEEGVWKAVPRSYRVARGRGPNTAAKWFVAGGNSFEISGEPLMFQWKHYAPSDRRIDPAKTNIIDMFILTNEYDFITRQWIANGADMAEMPPAPTELDLRMTFGEFEEFKMFSDDIVWRPVKYKFLFGNGAEPELRVQFKIVKMANTSMSDGEIKSRVVRAINQYFNPQLWDFGETFYFTELAAYIHQQLANVIASIVPVPQDNSGSFGDGFEVKCRSDEIFISTAQVSDVIIINSNTPTNLRIS